MESLCVEFINTEWSLTHEPFRELLQDPDWIRAFLARWDIPLVIELTDLQFAQLMQLRKLLSDLVSTISETGRLTAEELGAFNPYLSSVPVYQELQQPAAGFSLLSVPTCDPWTLVLYHIAASFAELLVTGDLRRLKRCENVDCRYVYYDESKSCTRRWCCNTCASLVKVRRFRQRKKDRSE